MKDRRSLPEFARRRAWRAAGGLVIAVALTAFCGVQAALAADPEVANRPGPPQQIAPPQPLDPPNDADAVSLLTDLGPGSEQSGQVEAWESFLGQRIVRNVTRPQLLPVRPKPGTSNGKAVIVVPGGGYLFLSIDSEGLTVAQRLAERGYTAFVLKYRTQVTPAAPAEFLGAAAAVFGTLGKATLPDNPPAVADLAAAVQHVQRAAATWQVDPQQVGVIGFSAGARTAIRLIEQRSNDVRPAHVALLYPPMERAVAGGVRPPLFLAIAVDDPLFVQGGLGLLEAWLAQSHEVEFHLYSGGSHGFGMRRLGTTSDGWIDQYLAWLDVR